MPLPSVPGGSKQIYLKLTGINGDVTRAGHKGDIFLLALDTALPVTSGPPCQNFTFRKPTDGATPSLFLAAKTGHVFPTAVFSEYNLTSRGTLVRTLQISLQTLQITSIHHVDSTTTGAYDDVTLGVTGSVDFKHTNPATGEVVETSYAC